MSKTTSKISLVNDLLNLGIGTPGVLKSATTDVLQSLMNGKSYKLPSYNEQLEKYLAGDKPELTKFYNWARLVSVRFPLPNVTYDQFQSNPNGVPLSPSLWGDTQYFLNALRKKLGPNWAKIILSPKENLNKYEGMKRLGVPGRQGTVVKLTIAGIDYAIKVASPKTSCGDGATGSMGFLKQARMQQLAANCGVSCPVYAVHCLPGKKEAPFMAMPMMGQRMVDIYKRGQEWSKAHQKQFWNCFLALDVYAGLVHNDGNCLNVMTDPNGVVKLIDFDRSFLVDSKRLNKKGPYPNMYLQCIHSCVREFHLSFFVEKLAKLFMVKLPSNHGFYKFLNIFTKSLGQEIKYNTKEAIFFKPFRVPKTIVYFSIERYELGRVAAFCNNLTKDAFKRLLPETQELFLMAAPLAKSNRIAKAILRFG